MNTDKFIFYCIGILNLAFIKVWTILAPEFIQWHKIQEHFLSVMPVYVGVTMLGLMTLIMFYVLFLSYRQAFRKT